MENITLLKDGGISGVGEKLSAGRQDIHKSAGLSFWKHLFENLRASLNASYETDWEKNTGLQWKDWGKL